MTVLRCYFFDLYVDLFFSLNLKCVLCCNIPWLVRAASGVTSELATRDYLWHMQSRSFIGLYFYHVCTMGGNQTRFWYSYFIRSIPAPALLKKAAGGKFCALSRPPPPPLQCKQEIKIFLRQLCSRRALRYLFETVPQRRLTSVASM
jgi:hypothetical protein